MDFVLKLYKLLLCPCRWKTGLYAWIESFDVLVGLDLGICVRGWSSSLFPCCCVVSRDGHGDSFCYMGIGFTVGVLVYISVMNSFWLAWFGWVKMIMSDWLVISFLLDWIGQFSNLAGCYVIFTMLFCTMSFVVGMIHVSCLRIIGS